MTERWHGSRYDGSLSTKAIAARIRADIKAAVEVGDLPGEPVSYGVRYRSFAGGTAIDVSIRGFANSRVEGEEAETDNRRAGKKWPWLTDEARKVMEVLEGIHRAYNHDGSDVMTDYFDVNYYGSVEFESEWGAKHRAAENAKRLANKDKPKEPKPDKKGLVRHVANDHRRSYSWATKSNFASLSAAHAVMHRAGRHAIDTNHTHEEGAWLTKAG